VPGADEGKLKTVRNTKGIDHNSRDGYASLRRIRLNLPQKESPSYDDVESYMTGQYKLIIKDK
jgi:hypothetical protein